MSGGFHPPSSTPISDPDPSARHHHHHHPPPPSAAHLQLSPFDSPAFHLSDDDDDPSESGGQDGRRGSPWHRMKWSDDTVRLLISVVASVGDADAPALDAAGRRPGAALQKKGKWKEVSRLMMERGCYVSPQQCEDKFNDLNKRYKRLNDILGRGTTCDVVENPALLDSMPNVSAKSKEDIRKILSSKHLFYREMCAYHTGGASHSGHDPDPAPGPAGAAITSEEEEEEEEVDDDDDESDYLGNGGRSYSLWAEMDAVMNDGAKSAAEKMEWIRERRLHLEEEGVEIETEGMEIEKRLFKWQRFRTKKDREMERMRLENERMMLDNARMMVLVKRRELDLEQLGKPTGVRVNGERSREMMEAGE